MLVTPLELIVFILGAFALGYWLRWRQTLAWSVRDVRAACSHSWGPARSLFDQGRRNEWYRHCVRCGEQQNGESETGPWKVL